MTEWKAYTGSDEQIAELNGTNSGFLVRYRDGFESDIQYDTEYIHTFIAISAYWIIPDDPLREMKVRQAQTGQPVWWRHKLTGLTGGCDVYHSPFEYFEDHEYSFTPFED